MPSDVRWCELEDSASELAAAGRSLLYHHGLGLGYLATVRPGGGPRLHPFCPILAIGGLWGFINRGSPKAGDLRRDGRYAIHAFPNGRNDDEFTVDGRAVECHDETTIASVRTEYRATTQTPAEEALFEFRIERAMLAVYDEKSTWPPTYTRWSATPRSA